MGDVGCGDSWTAMDGTEVETETESGVRLPIPQIRSGRLTAAAAARKPETMVLFMEYLPNCKAREVYIQPEYAKTTAVFVRN